MLTLVKQIAFIRKWFCHEMGQTPKVPNISLLKSKATAVTPNEVSHQKLEDGD